VTDSDELAQTLAYVVQAIEIGLGDPRSGRQQSLRREPVPGTRSRGEEIRAVFDDEVEMSVEECLEQPDVSGSCRPPAGLWRQGHCFDTASRSLTGQLH
jgi:hypothetical protein